MEGWTNAGTEKLLDYYFRRQGSLPSTFYLALLDSSIAPTLATVDMADVSEIPAGNGYTSGGVAVAADTTDFESIVKSIAGGYVEMTLKDIAYVSSGGDLPGSGSGARYAVLTDDNGTVADRVIYFYWDLVSNRIAELPNSIILQDTKIKVTQTT